MQLGEEFRKKYSGFGDVLLNFLASLCVLEEEGAPVNIKVPATVLYKIARKTNLRTYLPKRLSRKGVADYVEALFAWLWIERGWRVADFLSIMEKKNLEEAIASVVLEGLRLLKSYKAA
ncbi:hypothetical protein DRN94_002325 [archaeon]|nr:hypothetical protein [archaeon]